jgi:tetratricopeptide (TPR) repeat protein
LSPAGRLSVNDFGLARVLEQPGMTMTGEVVGTPAYMSPEQITAGRIPLDHRTDVYSLGATLYELLTLQPPFTGTSQQQILAQIVQKDPPLPRRLNKKVPLDLETICLKALEKDPDRRYQTAGAVAEDLRRYVNRFAITARRAGPVHRLAKWARRHPAVAASLACLLIAVVLALAFASWAYHEKQQRLIEQERARLELLDEKTRNAYQVATSGDLKRTDDAIKEIEALGASTGQVRLLRGVVAYFRQDAEGAIGELEQAVKLLPESVAARALLAMSYTDYGQPERAEQLILDLQQLSPVSAEDYLFKGYVREANEPGQGLADLNEGIRRRDSPLGRALRAFIRTNRAIDTGQTQDVAEALRDANVARDMLPDNQLALFASVYARLTAAALYQEAKLPEMRKTVLQEAARDVEALEPFIGLTNPGWMMWQYYDDTGEPDKALAVARRALEQSKGDPIPALYCATSLYRLGRFTEALQCLDRRRHPDLMGDVTRGFVLAELPDGPRLALDEFHKLTRSRPQNVGEMKIQRHAQDAGDMMQLSYLLLLLGKKEQARASLGRSRPSFAQSREWKEFYEAGPRFGGGGLSEDGYLAKAGTSRWRQCYAHTHVGLFRLADGDRAGAREHFAKALRTRAIWLFDWNWCEMLLSRLEHDPTWPPWIPVKN